MTVYTESILKNLNLTKYAYKNELTEMAAREVSFDEGSIDSVIS